MSKLSSRLAREAKLGIGMGEGGSNARSYTRTQEWNNSGLKDLGLAHLGTQSGEHIHHKIPLETLGRFVSHLKDEDQVRFNKLLRDELGLWVNSDPRGLFNISSELHPIAHRMYRQYGVQPSANNEYIKDMKINQLLTGEVIDPSYEFLEAAAREYLPTAKNYADQILDFLIAKEDLWKRAKGVSQEHLSKQEFRESVPKGFTLDDVTQYSGRDSRIDSPNITMPNRLIASV